MGDFVYRVANKRQSKKYVILKKLENEMDLNEDEIKFMLEMESNVMAIESEHLNNNHATQISQNNNNEDNEDSIYNQ